MPHAIIEYSANIRAAIQAAAITKKLHNTLMESGLFSPADIKTRAYMAEDFEVGSKGGEGSFLHVTVYLLEGRTIAQRQTLSAAIQECLQLHLTHIDQVSVDIRDMVRDTYRKYAG